jgi:hypothetical protein
MFERNAILILLLFFSFGIASKRWKEMFQGIRWGLIVHSVLGLSKWWGGKVGETKTTMLLPMVRIGIDGSRGSCFVRLG